MTTPTPEISERTAFTSDGGAGGNPAGVVLEADGLHDAARLALAARLGHSETAFLESRSEPGRFRVRYWSPRAEVPFCGHATVAAAVALAERDGVGQLMFETAVGEVPVLTRRTDEGVVATLTSVPTRTRPATSEEVANLLVALRWDSDDIDPRYPVHVSNAGNDHAVLAVHDRARLAALDYDYPALEALMADRGWTTVHLVWAEAPTVYHARDPFPPGGVVEDPATGAAAAAFGGYLRDLGLVPLPSRVSVLQGADMGRPSRLLVDVTTDRRVQVTGAGGTLRT